MGQDGLTFVTIERGGQYLRVADPGWANPLDTSFARASGGRWNPAGSFPVLYVNAEVATARTNVDRKFADLPYGPMDLRPERRPVLVALTVAEDRYVDIVTDDGCMSAGLPTSYPLDDSGREIRHETCQPVGEAAQEQGLPGIACRSAARPTGEELAWFTDDAGRPTETHVFDDWYWG